MPNWQGGDIDEDGDEVAVCLECGGTGRGEFSAHELTPDDLAEDEPTPPDCPVCCGFGRLDW